MAIEPSENVKGYYTSALYNVYGTLKTGDSPALKRTHMYVIKIHNPLRTTVHALWNQYGVKTHPNFKNRNFSIKHLPRLAFEEVTAKVQLEDNLYHFSVLHAARGTSALETYQNFNKLSAAGQTAQTPLILSSLSQIGQSLGTFHSYHALKDPNLRNDCIRYILKIGDVSAFATITHNDLHPGNIIVDSSPTEHPRVTLIDLESMFLSNMSPYPNSTDVMFFSSKIEKIFKDSEAPKFISHFKSAYEKSLKDTLKHFVVSGLLKRDLITALRSQSSPKATLVQTLLYQDFSEKTNGQSFY